MGCPPSPFHANGPTPTVLRRRFRVRCGPHYIPDGTLFFVWRRTAEAAAAAALLEEILFCLGGVYYQFFYPHVVGLPSPNCEGPVTHTFGVTRRVKN